MHSNLPANRTLSSYLHERLHVCEAKDASVLRLELLVQLLDELVAEPLRDVHQERHRVRPHLLAGKPLELVFDVGAREKLLGILDRARRKPGLERKGQRCTG